MADLDLALRHFKKRLEPYGWEFKGSVKDYGEILGLAAGWTGAIYAGKGIPVSLLLRLGLSNPALAAIGTAGFISTSLLAIPLIAAAIEAAVDASIPISDVLGIDPQYENNDKDRFHAVTGFAGFYQIIYKLKKDGINMQGKANNVVSANKAIVSNNTRKQFFNARTFVTTNIVRKEEKSWPDGIFMLRANGQGSSEAQTSLNINLDAGTFEASLNSYFSARCHVRTSISGRTPTTMNGFVYDFFGVNKVSGSLPGKGMVIAGNTTGTSSKGEAFINYYFVCY